MIKLWNTVKPSPCSIISRSRLQHSVKDSNKLSLALILTRCDWHHFVQACSSVTVPLSSGQTALWFRTLSRNREGGGFMCEGIKSSMACQRLCLSRKCDLQYITQIAPDLWPGNGPARLSSICLHEHRASCAERLQNWHHYCEVWFLHLSGFLRYKLYRVAYNEREGKRGRRRNKLAL